MTAILFQLFSALAGFVEAVLYCRQGAEAFRWNEHVGLTLQRGAALIGVGAGVLFDAWLFQSHAWAAIVWVVVQVAAAMLLFSFAHNNSYNLTRLWITADDEYDLHANGRPYSWRLPLQLAWSRFSWSYQSPTTTARFDLDARQRNLQALAGLLLLLTAYAVLELCTR